jgi:undecaprenyl-diphosphatase
MLLKAIVLGIVQGLTEFIPVSSSGHLLGVRQLMGWNDAWLDQTFDVALHIGTLVALVSYYRHDWWSITRGFLNHILKQKPYCKDDADGTSGRLMVPILVACVPAAIVGYVWEDFIEHQLGQWYMIAAALVVIGIVMLLADMTGKKNRGIDKMNYTDFITIGFAQALSLFPGVSRSGITISAGLFRGLERAAAARFSFLLSTPIIIGAGLKKLMGLVSTGLQPGEAIPMIVGVVTASISGYLAIHFLIAYLRTRTLVVFVVYRIAFAAVLALVFLTR